MEIYHFQFELWAELLNILRFCKDLVWGYTGEYMVIESKLASVLHACPYISRIISNIDNNVCNISVQVKDQWSRYQKK